MNEPRSWTLHELTRDAETARGLFRRARLDEPLALYSQFFSTFVPILGTIIDRLPTLASATADPGELAELVATADAKTAFRYLAAPPVSEDDLKTLAETTLPPTTLRGDAEQARRVREIVLHVIDPHRFPWVHEGRRPTGHERTQAIVASAVLDVISGVFKPDNLQTAQAENLTIFWSHRLSDLASFVASAT